MAGILVTVVATHQEGISLRNDALYNNYYSLIIIVRFGRNDNILNKASYDLFEIISPKYLGLFVTVSRIMVILGIA